jgi:hypothetical protein
MMLRFVGFHHSSTERLNYKEAQLKESSNTDLSICHLKIILAGHSIDGVLQAPRSLHMAMAKV